MDCSKLWGIIGVSILSISSAVAGTMGRNDSTPQYRIVAALSGGYANINSSKTQTYIGNDDDNFIYFNENNGRDSGFIGGFFGIERPLSLYDLSLQAGIEYNYFGRVTVDGLHTVGNDPESSTLYQYHYQFQTQQALAVAKLFTTVYETFHPYALVGLGAGFNNLNDYSSSTQETGTINLSPTFNNHSTTSFAYSLGAGIDTSLSQNLRVGLGYRYTNFGKAQFGDGGVHFNNQIFPVPFSLGSSNIDAQQFIAQLTYLI